MHDLTGRVAIVSGAGSVGPGWGNGKATAVLLARQGAKIFALDINPAAVEETRGLIAAEGGTCATHVCDMTDSAQVSAMVEACVSQFGQVDILVNNVGGSAPGDAVTMAEELWDRQVDHNLKTVFLGCKYAIPVMERQGRGAIVNLSSVAGLRDHAGRSHVAYSATKAAVVQFTRATAIAYAKKGIRLNTVIPGLMHTPLVEHRLAATVADGNVAALIAQRNAQVPIGKMGTGWDVANAVLFLVSDEAGYITATEILVDGGYVAVTG
ncbi:SDR family NAD(P)-dependent oxidoreductase [Acidisphaera sp. L21]|jgi:NAD(P)-dependent dehydrogenase (short-subunit alcohol dehydrogenase family)|uniref:SDR family NAD(P)-dependent oxidoreductase n=1 Tax=Acidisphaera sp. L21 TaxID=1641851 RepID=UPI00131E034F|nr:SDR family NAD(P)-dependent oxidoreductase [Acidisphaera sp. L21]